MGEYSYFFVLASIGGFALGIIIMVIPERLLFLKISLYLVFIMDKNTDML